MTSACRLFPHVHRTAGAPVHGVVRQLHTSVPRAAHHVAPVRPRSTGGLPRDRGGDHVRGSRVHWPARAPCHGQRGCHVPPGNQSPRQGL